MWGRIECGCGLDVCGGCCWLGSRSFAVISRLPMLASFLLQKSGVVFPRNCERMLLFCRCVGFVEKAFFSKGWSWYVRGVDLSLTTVGPGMLRSISVGRGLIFSIS